MPQWCQHCDYRADELTPLVRCPKCHGAMGNSPRATRLTPEQQEEVRRIVTDVVGDSKFTPEQTKQVKRTILEVIGVKLTIIGIIGLIGYFIAIISGIFSVRKVVVGRVDAEFKTDRIRAVVAEAAAKQGTNLLENAVRPEMTRLKDEVNYSIAKVGEQTSNALSSLAVARQPIAFASAFLECQIEGAHRKFNYWTGPRYLALYTVAEGNRDGGELLYLESQDYSLQFGLNGGWTLFRTHYFLVRGTGTPITALTNAAAVLLGQPFPFIQDRLKTPELKNITLRFTFNNQLSHTMSLPDGPSRHDYFDRTNYFGFRQLIEAH